ncbi:ComEC/Rec2 family competence protein [Qipengyuania gelatinilytica]|uniref:ComEC family competence protein n=1 Tax=Qipengyuania gelatinilytica TaxID=2867231 RepID=A0ABX9A260_9SPHN|nr:ComEC/Rec2 family competence protein [Qipengyuania gelatinilytica]QZD95372.1 ComEC family competence protein [Qipengyuania gelatinilytica]
MATQGASRVPFGDADDTADVAVQRPWRMRALLSRFGDGIEAFLGNSGFDRGPWLVVALAAGIGSWFVLGEPWQWMGAIGLALLVSIASQASFSRRDERAGLRLAGSALGIAFALGMALIWVRSEMVGAEPIARPALMQLDARILDREEQPAEGRVRLVLAVRDAENARPLKLRVNVPAARDDASFREGARVRLRARLMPPSPPLLPGAYDFARSAWFKGYAATGSLVGDVELVEPAPPASGLIASIQRSLSGHVREHLDGPSGTIAAAFASGDRGSISEADEVAMRDAGLTHLLSISGLHVSAVIAAAYFLASKLIALFPWLTLRIRIPLVAAAIAALAGIAYTLLTGAQVPTVRSCVGAMLVLIALALGREPLSMRMVAVAAVVVLFLWPESLVGPSFQMSFAAVIGIVALHNSRPVRDFLAPREESGARWFGRRILMLFATGMVIEIALMPIVLFHFHRAGLYGAFANVIAIPLVTFISMPLIAVALVFDLIGAGAPFWWLAGVSLDLLLEIARTTAAQPGAVKLVANIRLATLLMFLAGALWIALWRGRSRLWGFVPALIGVGMLLSTPTPDILVTRDGRDIGVVDEDGLVHVLRESKGSYARDNIVELAGTEASPILLSEWEGARCSADFCSLPITRNERTWHVLVAKTRNRIDERQLAAACERADIVIADRWLPRSCRPKWMKADGRFLEKSGGLAIHLSDERFDAVVDSQGRHGWWRPTTDR